MKKSKLIKCNECNGVGFLDNEEGRWVCEKCYGVGKLDFIENILGKKEPDFSNIGDEIRQIAFKQIAEDIDKEILDMYLKKDLK